MYYTGLQELRGFAVLYVVLFHLGGVFSTELFVNGGQGVLIFFCLSGFIISNRHKDDVGVYSAIIFFKKRCIRIYTPYIPVYLTFVLLLYIGGKSESINFFSFIKNIFLIQLPSKSIHPYAWSLVYEMFYYMSFCICVLICRLPAYIYGVLVLTLSFFGGDKDLLLFSEYNAYFAIGVLFGCLLDYNFKVNRLVSYLSLVVMIVVPYVIENNLLTLVSVVTVLVFLVYTPLNIPFLCKLGDASYSIYLTHALILSVFKNIHEGRSVWEFLVVLFVVLLFGCSYYHYFERPWTKFLTAHVRNR